MNPFHFKKKYIRVYLFTLLFFLTSAGGIFAQENNRDAKVFTLDGCISEALNKHPKLKICERKSDQKKEKLRAINAGNLPQVDATASYDRLSYVPQSKQRYLGSSNNDYKADIVVTQPLYSGGRITSERDSARYAIDAAQQGYLAAREDVIFNVKSAYYKILFARDILMSKEDLLKYAELSYNTALDLNKRTKIPREETLLRLEVQLNEVKQELITAQNRLKIARKALLNAMGLDSTNTIEVQGLKEDIDFSEDAPVEIANNPEILKIAKEVKEADELVKVAKSAYYPQINTRYSYGYEWARLPTGDTEWIAGVAVDLNIWDWGKTKAEVNQAKAFEAELKSYGDLLIQRIGLELESARIEYESAQRIYKIAKTSLEKARKSLDLFGERYRDTLTTSIELLDAQKAFSRAQVNYASSLLDMRLAKAEIEKIAGKGYDLK